jgi:hypothetical protein
MAGAVVLSQEDALRRKSFRQKGSLGVRAEGDVKPFIFQNDYEYMLVVVAVFTAEIRGLGAISRLRKCRKGIC